MTEVKLPEYTEGCDADPEKVACAYPHTPLQKFLNARLRASRAAKAAAFLKKFQLDRRRTRTRSSLMIAEEKLSPEEAAKKWVERNENVWKPWVA